MAVAMAVIVTNYASNLPEALAVVVLGGLLQMALGLLRAGRFVAYTPHVVISGFMSGIGIIVILMQILPFVGAPSESGGAMGAIRALPEALDNINLDALAIAGVTLAVGVLWPSRVARLAPGPLVALLAGTLLGVLWLNGAPVIGEVPRGLRLSSCQGRWSPQSFSPCSARWTACSPHWWRTRSPVPATTRTGNSWVRG